MKQASTVHCVRAVSFELLAKVETKEWVDA